MSLHTGVSNAPSQPPAGASPPSQARYLVRLLRAYLPPYRRFIAVLVVLQVMQTVALLYLPTLTADIVDNGVLTGDTDFIVRRGALMVAVTLLQVVCVIGVVRYGAYNAMAVGRDIRAAVFDKVQSFSVRELGHFGTPSLTTRTTNDVQQVQSLVLAMLTMFVSAPVMGVGGVLLALGQDVPLATVLLVMVPVLGVSMLVIVRRLVPLFRKMQGRVDVVNRILREQIAGVRVVRAFTREEYEQRRFARANDELTGVSVAAGRLTTLMFPLAATTVNLFGIPVVWLGAYRVSSGDLELGAITAFLGYLALVLVAMVTATFTLMMVPRAEVCAERIAEVIATESTVAAPSAPVGRLPDPGRLELQRVDFRYPGAQAAVLRGVDLVARPGETTAIVGSTGSGKSTLLALVPRLADATAGHVLVGGEDVRRIDRSMLAKAVGYVPQTPYLFAGTVASNLRYGNPDASDNELWRALDVAQAADFVQQLPGGLEAPVAQGGTNFSGGQRQRLAIARALVRRPHIYLFDDSFSALDYATDARVRAALVRETAQATVVVVAQRVSTIRDAHRIVVLESGAVVGAGTHSELLDTNSVYREIVLSQAAGEEQS